MYSLDPDNFSIIHKEVHSHSITIKEAMFIHVNGPTLNRNLGKYQLLHVWDSILQASPMLHLKPSSLPTSPTPFLPQQYIAPKPSPCTALPPANSLSRLGHAFFLVSTKCRGQNTPKTPLNPSPIIQTLPHTAAPSR